MSDTMTLTNYPLLFAAFAGALLICLTTNKSCDLPSEGLRMVVACSAGRERKGHRQLGHQKDQQVALVRLLPLVSPSVRFSHSRGVLRATNILIKRKKKKKKLLLFHLQVEMKR